MKVIILLVVVLATSTLWSTDCSLAQCPEDPNDNGICDTLHVGVFPPDTLFTGPGQLLRIPIYVTHDVPNPNIDSIAVMVIPLCYTHTNEAKYCSLSSYWNRAVYAGPSLPRSIFRHLVLPSGDTLHNYMLDRYEQDPSSAWTWIFLFLDDTSHFWLTFSAITQPLFGEGSRVFLATLTFRVEDTMTICLDSCFWPPASHLVFILKGGVTKFVPRDNMPYCFSVSCPKRGDFDANCIIDLGDVVYLTNYLYRSGPPPSPLELGDTNCDGVVELGDRVKLTNYVYKGGPPPCSP
jgi:hypothetical protein